MNSINHAAYLSEKFYSINCESSNNSELGKLFNFILQEMKNSILVINNYKLILSTDNERQAEYIAKETKKFSQTLMTIKTNQFDLCNKTQDLDYTSKNYIQFQFFHNVANLFQNAKTIVEKTKNSVENNLEPTEDINHYESLCLSIVSIVLSEFRDFLETIEAKAFDISKNNFKVIKLMNNVLRTN